MVHKRRRKEQIRTLLQHFSLLKFIKNIVSDMHLMCCHFWRSVFQYASLYTRFSVIAVYIRTQPKLNTF